MNRDRWSVECIGSFARVDLWQTQIPIGQGSFCLGKWGGSVLGNDAVIVARELSVQGLATTCRILDATEADLMLVGSVLSSHTVVPVGRKVGECTRSLCLEDSTGRRSWVFSRLLSEPAGDLGELSADVIYVDYYTEFVEYLNRQLMYLDRKRQHVMVNLSAIAGVGDVPPLAVIPSVLQASIPHDLSFEEASRFAIQLGEATGSQRVLATMGVRGAVLAMGRETWHADTAVKLNGSILGAGAVFSSEVIVGLADGLDRDHLLEQSVRRAALRLQTAVQ